MINGARRDVDVFAQLADRAAAKEVAPLAPDRNQFDALVGVVADELLRRFVEVGVECAAQSFIRGDQDGNVMFITTRIKQWMAIIAGARR